MGRNPLVGVWVYIVSDGPDAVFPVHVESANDYRTAAEPDRSLWKLRYVARGDRRGWSDELSVVRRGEWHRLGTGGWRDRVDLHNAFPGDHHTLLGARIKPRRLRRFGHRDGDGHWHTDVRDGSQHYIAAPVRNAGLGGDCHVEGPCGWDRAVEIPVVPRTECHDIGASRRCDRPGLHDACLDDHDGLLGTCVERVWFGGFEHGYAHGHGDAASTIRDGSNDHDSAGQPKCDLGTNGQVKRPRERDRPVELSVVQGTERHDVSSCCRIHVEEL